MKNGRLLSLLATLVAPLLGSCREDDASTWSAEVRSPDGHWLATAESRYGAGPGTAWAATSVYLRQASQSPTEVLEFDQQFSHMHLTMQWLTPRDLEVSYGPRGPGDNVGVDLQVVRVADVNISLRKVPGEVTAPVPSSNPGAPTTSSEPADEAVWFWFATCDGPSITLELRLDGRALLKNRFPVCRASRNSAMSRGEAGRSSFWFRPERPIVWSGYRENLDTTRVGQRLEGDFWQAGADANDFLIGVSFATSDHVTMNTVHIAHPDKADTSQVAPGLVVLTYPTPRR